MDTPLRDALRDQQVLITQKEFEYNAAKFWFKIAALSAMGLFNALYLPIFRFYACTYLTNQCDYTNSHPNQTNCTTIYDHCTDEVAECSKCEVACVPDSEAKLNAQLAYQDCYDHWYSHQLFPIILLLGNFIAAVAAFAVLKCHPSYYYSCGRSSRDGFFCKRNEYELSEVTVNAEAMVDATLAYEPPPTP